MLGSRWGHPEGRAHQHLTDKHQGKGHSRVNKSSWSSATLTELGLLGERNFVVMQENKGPVCADRTVTRLPVIVIHLHPDLSLSNISSFCASLLLGMRAPGPESGRSSPYHSQLDVRSSTPTSYQAPKHFHIPGRPQLGMPA